jgi:hypothetical protein
MVTAHRRRRIGARAIVAMAVCLIPVREAFAQRITTPILPLRAPLDITVAHIAPTTRLHTTSAPTSAPTSADTARVIWVPATESPSERLVHGAVSATLTPEPPHRPRGPVARRGLLWGAIVGGVLGLVALRNEGYGGAVIGPVLGAAIGAPVGMVVLLLATPEMGAAELRSAAGLGRTSC